MRDILAVDGAQGCVVSFYIRPSMILVWRRFRRDGY